MITNRGSFSKGEEKGEKRGEKEEKEEKRRGNKEERKKKRTKIDVCWTKKGKWKAKKDDFAGHGKTSMEQYTPLLFSIFIDIEDHIFNDCILIRA